MTTYVNEHGTISVEVTEVTLREQGSRLAGGGDPLVIRKAELRVSSTFGGYRVQALGYAVTDEDAVARAYEIWDNKRLWGPQDV